MRLLHVLLAAVSLFAAPSAASTSGAASTVLFHGGRIVLNDGHGGVAAALLAHEGRVVAVGSLADLEKEPLARTAQRVDLRGGTAVPGLQDAHGRLEDLGAALDLLDLRGARTLTELVDSVRAAAAARPAGTWIEGRGFDWRGWEEDTAPDATLLSAEVADHPVLLWHQDGRTALANRAALALAGLDGDLANVPPVAGGRIVLDAGGRATGLLVDAAIALVASRIPPLDRATRLRRFEHAQELLVSLGLTAIHDIGTSPEMLLLLAELRDQGALRLRVIAYPDAQGDAEAAARSALSLAKDPAGLLSAPGLALRGDGTFAMRGAALLEDYADAPGERGAMLLADNELALRLAMCAEQGLQPVVVSTGDRSTRILLSMFERLCGSQPSFRELRPRLECVDLVAPKDWARFPALGVIPSLQPLRVRVEAASTEKRLGAERARGASAWSALAPDLRRLAFGSGFPSQSPDPRLGLHALRTQSLEGERGIDPAAAALAGFTSCAAYACRQDDARGRLVAGCAADLSVFDRDLSSVAPDELLQAQVRMTVINSRVVYRAR